MRKVAGALLATAAGLIALLSFKSHAPAASALTAAEGGTGSALTGSSASPAPTTGSASGAPAPTTSPSGGSTSSGTSGSAKNGTYTGSAIDTMYGPVQVRATVSGGKLTHIDVLQVPDNGRYENEIVAQALPMLQSEALSAQSANIDIVSGATFTSQGYAQSLQSALNQAGIK